MNKAFIYFAELIVGSAFLITALTITYSNLGELSSAFDSVKTEGTVFVETSEDPEEVLWNGEQIASKLYEFGEEGIPIEVDGFTFNKEEDVKDNLQRVSLKAKYKQSLELDGKGKVTKIIFRKVT